MGTASSGEWIAILLYFALVIGVGVYFFFRDRHQEGEKEYFLGGRSMGGWVAALSAGASDMSAWVLMGLPGSIYLYGICLLYTSFRCSCRCRPACSSRCRRDTAA